MITYLNYHEQTPAMMKESCAKLTRAICLIMKPLYTGLGLGLGLNHSAIAAYMALRRFIDFVFFMLLFITIIIQGRIHEFAKEGAVSPVPPLSPSYLHFHFRSPLEARPLKPARGSGGAL